MGGWIAAVRADKRILASARECGEEGQMVLDLVVVP